MLHSEEKLRGVRTRLLLSYPFFGSAIGDLALLPSSEVKRIYCNGASMLYRESFVEESTPAEIAYWVCREILHLTMDYGERKKHRSRILWALAAEYSVNAILESVGLASGAQVMFYRRDFAGRSTEEIYSTLVRESIKADGLGEIEQLDSWIRELTDRGDLRNRESEFSGVARNMKLKVDAFMAVLSEACDRYRDYGDYKAKTVEIIAKARLSERTLGRRGFSVDLPIMAEKPEMNQWEDILSAYVFNDREGLSYRKFQRKYMSSGIYLPQRYHLFNSIIVCIDVSASIGEKTAATFFSDVLYLVGSRVGDIAVRLIQIDARIQSDVYVEATDDPGDILRRKGFGGTDFNALFNRLDSENNRDPVVIFTDGRAAYPDVEPENYNVVWVTTDLHVPWGTNIDYGGRIEA